MDIILAHNHFSNFHLAHVKKIMKKLGTPTIKAIYDREHNAYIALEGCHRIRAAKYLGFVPNIEELEFDDIKHIEMFNGNLDLDFDCPGMTIEDFVNDAKLRKIIEF